MSRVKECSKCRTLKPTNEFYMDGRTRDGFSYYCRPCKQEIVRKSSTAGKARLSSELQQLVDWYAYNLTDHNLIPDKYQVLLHRRMSRDLSRDIVLLAKWEPPPVDDDIDAPPETNKTNATPNLEELWPTMAEDLKAATGKPERPNVPNEPQPEQNKSNDAP